MLKLQDIRHLHVELTTRCNARCPMCMRNYRGYDYNSGYPLCELSLEDFKKIVDPGLLPQITGVTFNGNLGDFASARDAVEIVEYLVDHKVSVWINTNGSLRSSTWWSRLALPRVTVGFALDGLADTHHLYRQDTDWHKIIRNAQALITAGGRAIWRFVPFDHNRHQEDDCRKLAEIMGFAGFENIYDGRHSTPVFDRKGNYSYQIGKDPRITTPEIKQMLQSHITWYDAATIKHPKDTATLNLRCIHRINKEIYIAADGSIYPCCYLGFYPKTMHHPGNKELRELVYENNALEYPLEHCLAWFDGVDKSWQQPSIAQGRTYQCVSTCNQVSQ